MRVLVVEDDRERAEAIAYGLRQRRIVADVAVDGSDGLARALVGDYDVIVLDRDLPGTRGDQVCERLLESSARARVLMLTAAAEIEDQVDGLELGADDYLPKPFDFRCSSLGSGSCFGERSRRYRRSCGRVMWYSIRLSARRLAAARRSS